MSRCTILGCSGRGHRLEGCGSQLGFALALGVAVTSGAAQRFTILTNGQNLQTPINHGLPDKQLGFTFCRLRYREHPQGEKVRLGR